MRVQFLFTRLTHSPTFLHVGTISGGDGCRRLPSDTEIELALVRDELIIYLDSQEALGQPVKVTDIHNS